MPYSLFDRRVAFSIEASIIAQQKLLADSTVHCGISGVVEVILQALKTGNKLLLFGNGGSAADAQHIAADFVGRFAFDRPALPAVALTVNTSSVTAIANDYGFEHVFSRQIEAFGRPDDVAVGLSTSGNSPNVLSALAIAIDRGLRTVALTGTPGGKLKQLQGLDFCLCAPSCDTPRIQECHMLIGHVIAEIVEQELFHAKGRVSGS
jgi:D-sedoheptulose 7-phosphate isomerase